MRDLVWDRPSLARKYRDRFRARPFLPFALRDADEDIELAFYKVWLAGELDKLPEPKSHDVDLPLEAATGVAADIAGLRSACGLNPLPRRRPVRHAA
jgi:hypothetical protein